MDELRRWWHEPPAGATRESTTVVTGMLYVCVGLMYAAAFVCFRGLHFNPVLQLAWVCVPIAIGACAIRLGRRVPPVLEHVSPMVGLAGALTFVALSGRGPASAPLAMPVLTVIINSPFKFSLREVSLNTLMTVTATAAVLWRLGVPSGDIAFVVAAWLPVVGLIVLVARWGDAAERDPLTGLINRRGFERRLEAAAVDRDDSVPLTVALLDLDRFKLVNDLHGHHAGDLLLMACADAWLPLMPPDAILSRRGGDEFAVLLPHLEERAADALFARVRAACADRVTLSMGVAVLAPGEATVDLLRRADQALYDAKRLGRDRCVRSRDDAAPVAAATSQVPDRVTGLYAYDPDRDDATGATAALVIIADRYDAATHVVGPAAGNEVLARTAERLLGATEGMRVHVRRLRQTGFVVLLCDHSAAEVRALTERLVVPPIQSELSLHGSLTAGVAIGPTAGHTPQVATPPGCVSELVEAARTAADVARREQPGRFVFFEPRMLVEERERAAIASALRTAIVERDFDLVFQPQLRMADGALVGVEVLARWHHAGHGAIPPCQFIPLAEELGMTRPLDILITEKSCLQLRAWDDAGIHVPHVSVNISPQTVAAGQLHHGLPRLLAESNLTADRLLIEVTETELLHGPDGAALLQHVRDLGIRVSLDDFGAGYSSFGRLAALPIDELKIDRSLLVAIKEPAARRSVLAAMIKLGRALGLDVVTEGVEDPAQHELLRELGCHIGQGYYYGRPMAAEAFEAWLADRMVALSDTSA